MKIVSQLAPTHSKFYSNSIFEWNTEVSETHNIESIIKEDIFPIAPPYVEKENYAKQLRTNGLVLFDAKIEAVEEIQWSVSIEGDCVMMVFILDGFTDSADKSPDGKATDTPERHNLQYAGNYRHSITFEKGTLLDAFCIFLSKDFYFKLTGETNNIHNEFALHIHRGLDKELSDHFLPMNFEMESIITKVRNCTRQGSFHRLCLEIKVQELLLLQLEQYHSMFGKMQPKQFLHNDDIDKIKTACNILKENYNTPPTIKNLSRMVGINEFKLKKGFKQLFQSTIHEYVIKYRMEKANLLVREQNLQVKEVAMELGYKNPSHFSAAFKKHFGFLPTEMAS